MKRQKSAVPVVLAALVMMLLTAVPAAAESSVIHYGGTYAEVTTEQDFDQFTLLPGGRVLMEGRVVRQYYRCDPVGEPDRVSGWYVARVSAIVLPGGAVRSWGTIESVDLDYWEGLDLGGIHGTWAAAVSPGGDIMLHSKTLGWGEWEGHDGWHHEIWRDGQVSFFGHYKMP